LDPESGEYNIKYVQEIISNLPVKIITLVGRQQGLLVAKGNPKRIISLQDVTRNDVSYINRQSGAGTRVLFDYHLRQSGLSSDRIQGYQNEEYTHLGVAAAIASERGDCGLAIEAAAQALGLDFIPLYQERYDLVIPLSYYESQLLKPLLELLNNQDFKNSVASLPGYNTAEMGRVIL
jgi:putative molybdopterin biosynthesis protein